MKASLPHSYGKNWGEQRRHLKEAISTDMLSCGRQLQQITLKLLEFFIFIHISEGIWILLLIHWDSLLLKLLTSFVCYRVRSRHRLLITKVYAGAPLKGTKFMVRTNKDDNRQEMKHKHLNVLPLTNRTETKYYRTNTLFGCWVYFTHWMKNLPFSHF